MNINTFKDGIVEDQMSIVVEQTKILCEDTTAVVLHALHCKERSEAILDKYGLYLKKGK